MGTPIVAAFDGEIVFQGDGGGYGNLVTDFARKRPRDALCAYAAIRAKTASAPKVKAGDIIGYVGTTGLSTGPHLHFELYQNGEAIDPLGTVTAVAHRTIPLSKC